MQLPEIKATKKTGSEAFEIAHEKLEFTLKDFWSWNQSNLIENRTRGILAEFIVKQALGIDSEVRVEWDAYDLISNKGKKIEVKSASYIQSWNQKKYSTIKFGIAPTNLSAHNPNSAINRCSDLYIFCLLEIKDQELINPLNLNQWTFYIMETAILNQFRPTQKTITLNSLLRLNPIKCSYTNLKNLIDGS